jgi:solute carrier family 35 protein E1
VDPVTHAVGNTLKRVVLISSSLIIFKNPISRQGIIGSTAAVIGTLLYSLAQQKYSRR